MLDWAVDNWKWLTGPVVLAVLYFLTADRSKRREGEVAAWRAARTAKKGEPARGKPGARSVPKLPDDLGALVENVAGGAPVGTFELAPKLAYLAVCNADALSGSDHQTVVAKLDGPPISLTVRPLPVVEGGRASQGGIEFKKDPEFTEQFLVEGTDGASAKKWLVAPIRQALLDLPDVWLTVRGRLMALTVFGPADSERLEELVQVADAIFGEHGAGGAPSLVGEDPDEGEDDSDDSDDDEDEAPKGADPADPEPPRVVVVKASPGKPVAKAKPKTPQKKSG